jgi:hypothetical protein
MGFAKHINVLNTTALYAEVPMGEGYLVAWRFL